MQLRDVVWFALATSLLAVPAAAQEASTDAAAADAAAADAAAADAAAADAAAAGDASDGEASTAPDPTEAPAAADDEATTGSLTVSSSPSGKVIIDGEDTGLQTPLIDVQLPAGTHTITVIEEATGRTKEITFHLEGGSVLNLNLNLPEAPAADAVADGSQASSQPAQTAAVADPAPTADDDEADDWTWLTVAGWAALGVGTLGLLAGAVILTTPTDPDQGPLGFGLFGAGAGLVLGGSVLLYLDSELADAKLSFFGLGGDDDKKDGDAPAEGEAADDEENTASLSTWMSRGALATAAE